LIDISKREHIPWKTVCHGKYKHWRPNECISIRGAKERQIGLDPCVAGAPASEEAEKRHSVGVEGNLMFV